MRDANEERLDAGLLFEKAYRQCSQTPTTGFVGIEMWATTQMQLPAGPQHSEIAENPGLIAGVVIAIHAINGQRRMTSYTIEASARAGA